MTKFRTMYFSNVRAAKNTVLSQLYVTMGVEAMRGMTILRIDSMVVILAGATSTKAATARRNRARNLYYDQDQDY